MAQLADPCCNVGLLDDTPMMAEVMRAFDETRNAGLVCQMHQLTSHVIAKTHLELAIDETSSSQHLPPNRGVTVFHYMKSLRAAKS